MSKPSRSWCFTLNNPTESEIEFFMNLQCNQCVIGKEEGDSGTPHLQGYIVWSKSTRISALKKLSPRAHWEPTRAAEAAANYCMKENIIRKQLPVVQKKASEIVFDSIRSGKSVRDIVIENPNLAFQVNAIERAAELLKPELDWRPPVVTWIWGPTGCGKTHYIYEKEEADELSVINLHGRFFQGYDNSRPGCLLDDLRPGDISYNFLLRLTDSYPGVTVNIKHGSTKWVPYRLYITSDRPPESFAPRGENSQQLVRRIHHVIYKNTPFKL